jgi:HAD superfamily hydrolase (TIGR01509 family)
MRGVRWRLVIFDCDGVLVDSEGIANRILAERLTAIGLPTSTEEAMHEYMGRSMPSCLEQIEEKLQRPVPSGWVDDLRARTFDAFERGLRAVPGVEAALDKISVPTCVASSGDREKMQTTLALTGLLPRFEGRLFSASDVGRGKPFPDLFLHAAASMGVSPQACAVVEDTVPGVSAGRAAGMKVFGFARHAAADALSAAGAQVFSRMESLPELLGE